MKKKLTRSNNRIIAGVCGGIAQYLGISAKTVRVIYLILALILSITGPGMAVPLAIYVLLIFIMPPAPGPSVFDFSSLFGTNNFQTTNRPTKQNLKKERKIITDVKEKDITDKK